MSSLVQKLPALGRWKSGVRPHKPYRRLKGSHLMTIVGAVLLTLLLGVVAHGGEPALELGHRRRDQVAGRRADHRVFLVGQVRQVVDGLMRRARRAARHAVSQQRGRCPRIGRPSGRQRCHGESRQRLLHRLLDLSSVGWHSRCRGPCAVCALHFGTAECAADA